MLKFAPGNAKLSKKIYHFSLPAGWTCPGANECKSQVKIVDGKRVIKDGPKTVFRCFAASQEVLYKNTYNARQHNLNALKGLSLAAMIKLIESSLPKKAGYVRIHVSGDFYSQKYFDAWCQVAANNPTKVFYAYTKSLPFWIARQDTIPANFSLTASYGGKYDDLIAKHSLRYAKVIFSEEEANGLPIDHDDSHAINPVGNFALLIHGIQPKDSEAGKALVKLRKAGIGGYSR